MFIKQFKGKDLDKISPKLVPKGPIFGGIKYDGNYVQIQKVDYDVRFFTSGGKEFYAPNYADMLIETTGALSFTLETEYIAKTKGIMGDRDFCTTTTFRTEFSKGITSNDFGHRFMIFDILDTNTQFANRRLRLQSLNIVDTVEFKYYSSIAELKEQSYKEIAKGYEGMFGFTASHIIRDKGRSNEAIKFKESPRVSLLCVGTKDGEGKYTGLIGSLTLFNEELGIQVSVGSGLDDTRRSMAPTDFIGNHYTIAYDRLADTYVQPRLKWD